MERLCLGQRWAGRANGARFTPPGSYSPPRALFVCVARGFGSKRWLRDLAIGLVLGLLVFLFFVRFLNVNLPAGWLSPILGGAGI